jgi:hypothetical protein
MGKQKYFRNLHTVGFSNVLSVSRYLFTLNFSEILLLSHFNANNMGYYHPLAAAQNILLEVRLCVVTQIESQ